MADKKIFEKTGTVYNEALGFEQTTYDVNLGNAQNDMSYEGSNVFDGLKSAFKSVAGAVSGAAETVVEVAKDAANEAAYAANPDNWERGEDTVLDNGEVSIPQASYHLKERAPEVAETKPVEQTGAQTYAATEPAPVKMTPIKAEVSPAASVELVRKMQELLVEQNIDISYTTRSGVERTGKDAIDGDLGAKTLAGIKELLGRDNITEADVTPDLLEEAKVAAAYRESPELIAATKDISDYYENVISGQQEPEVAGEPGIVITITKSAGDFLDDIADKNAGRGLLSEAYGSTLDQGGFDGDGKPGIAQEAPKAPDSLDDKNVNVWNATPDSMAP
ncbi:MAG: hypothetical protein H6868_08430 [Rhodospirillales bacterium]|nr:hypothetical protein [Rhodospirillales bacterium]